MDLKSDAFKAIYSLTSNHKTKSPPNIVEMEVFIESRLSYVDQYIGSNFSLECSPIPEYARKAPNSFRYLLTYKRARFLGQMMVKYMGTNLTAAFLVTNAEGTECRYFRYDMFSNEITETNHLDFITHVAIQPRPDDPDEVRTQSVSHFIYFGFAFAFDHEDQSHFFPVGVTTHRELDEQLINYFYEAQRQGLLHEDQYHMLTALYDMVKHRFFQLNPCQLFA